MLKTNSGGSDGEESAHNAGVPGLIPELKSPHKKGMATHFKVFFPGESMDKTAW